MTEEAEWIHLSKENLGTNRSKRERESNGSGPAPGREGEEELSLGSAACVWWEFDLKYSITSPCSQTLADYQHTVTQKWPASFTNKLSAPGAAHPDSSSLRGTFLAPRCRRRRAMVHVAPHASSHVHAVPLSWVRVVLGEWQYSWEINSPSCVIFWDLQWWSYRWWTFYMYVKLQLRHQTQHLCSETWCSQRWRGELWNPQCQTHEKSKDLGTSGTLDNFIHSIYIYLYFWPFFFHLLDRVYSHKFTFGLKQW